MDEHLDLNLLVILDALLERGSVKEAAAELGEVDACGESLPRSDPRGV